MTIGNVHWYIFTALFQPPPLIEYFPVLHYVVSYNTSDNSTVIQTQLSSSISSYTVSSEPGVTYYITVRAVNAVGPGDISGYNKIIVNGEIILIITIILNYMLSSSLFSAPVASYKYCNTTLNYCSISENSPH